MWRRLAGAALAAATLLFGGTAQAEVRALIVAAGAYKSNRIQSLAGPPNDAAAMKALLTAQGATDIVTLADGEATRTAIRTALRGLGARAKPGDWIVFFYAGHGAQSKARDASEADGLDEFLMLPGFDPDRPDAEGFVIDNELRGWLVNFFPASVNVL